MNLDLEAIETSCDLVEPYGDKLMDEFHAGLLAAARSAQLMPLPVVPVAPEQRILAVEFRSPDGRCWNAIGGGATVAAAIDYAHESCPDDVTWDIVRWNDLYGD